MTYGKWRDTHTDPYLWRFISSNCCEHAEIFPPVVHSSESGVVRADPHMAWLVSTRVEGSRFPRDLLDSRECDGGANTIAIRFLSDFLHLYITFAYIHIYVSLLFYLFIFWHEAIIETDNGNTTVLIYTTVQDMKEPRNKLATTRWRKLVLVSELSRPTFMTKV